MDKYSRIVMLLMIFLLSGCTQTENNHDQFVANREKEKTILVQQMKDPKSFKSPDLIEDFNILAETRLSVEADTNRIVYNVILDKPKSKMDDVVISFHLEKGMELKLLTNDVFFTNLNDDEKTLADLSPGGELKGTTAFRGFIIKKELLDEAFFEDYKNVYVHVSWVHSGQKQEKFILVKAQVEEDLVKFLKN
jgi:hypothetical protein